MLKKRHKRSPQISLDALPGPAQQVFDRLVAAGAVPRRLAQLDGVPAVVEVEKMSADDMLEAAEVCRRRARASLSIYADSPTARSSGLAEDIGRLTFMSKLLESLAANRRTVDAVEGSRHG